MSDVRSANNSNRNLLYKIINIVFFIIIIITWSSLPLLEYSYQRDKLSDKNICLDSKRKDKSGSFYPSLIQLNSYSWSNSLLVWKSFMKESDIM